jgi:hypothetical protein
MQYLCIKSTKKNYDHENKQIAEIVARSLVLDRWPVVLDGRAGTGSDSQASAAF